MLISDFKHGLFKYEVKDYYSILGVPISADPKTIRVRYLKLAYQLHPDTNRAATKEEKDQASNILSKIVNPAYENLYKDKLRKECELIFAEIAQRLAPDFDKIILTSEIAKKLLQEDDQKLAQKYQELIEQIRKDQYQDFNKVLVRVGLLSELNMIYLVRQKQQELSQVSTVEQSSQSDSPAVEKEPLTRLEKLILSAKKHIETVNYERALFDLREAVKLDANCAEAHALLGSVYLEQNNKTYGRIHINKAVSLDSSNPEVKKAQEKLDAIENKGKKAQAKASKKSKKGGKDKKESPKIFGIRLW